MISISCVSSLIQSSRSIARFGLFLLIALAVVVEPAPAQAPAEPGAESELSAQAGPKKHRKRQGRPVKMGTSGGNVNDFTLSGGFIFCCSGTLGGLVRKDEGFFVLSNNHVMAQVNQGSAGDDINQPGFLDSRCNDREGDHIGQLTGYKKMKLNGKNKVDAAIALADDGTVDESGAVIGIGVPGDEAIKPAVGMRVQKSGRTTGVRKGVIDSVNNTILVEYQEECSDTARIFILRFVKQFFVVSSGRKNFSAGGDSGSLIVEDVGTCPNPVGLLFAGNSQITAGNPMPTVMNAVNKMKPKGPAELVGCAQPAGGLTFEAQSGIPELGDREMRLARRIQTRMEDDIFALKGVHAMGIGRSSAKPDAPVFKVYVDPAQADPGVRMPRELQGIPVEVVETPKLRSLNCVKSPLAK